VGPSSEIAKSNFMLYKRTTLKPIRALSVPHATKLFASTQDDSHQLKTIRMWYLQPNPSKMCKWICGQYS